MHHIHLILRVIFRIVLCYGKLLTDITGQVFIRCLPLVGQRIPEDNSCKLLSYGFFFLSRKLCHIVKVYLGFFSQGDRQSLACGINACHHLCVFDGTLREHIRFSKELALIIQLLQGTEQAV